MSLNASVGNFCTAFTLFLLAGMSVASPSPQDSIGTRIMPAIEERGEIRNSRQVRRPIVEHAPEQIRISPLGEEKTLPYVLKKTMPGTPHQIGIAREISEFAQSQDVSRRLFWRTSATGRPSASLSISTPGAVGTRLGILIHRIPEEAVLRFYSPAAATAIEVSGLDILTRLKHNAYSGDLGQSGQTFWGPYIEGDEVILQFELPSAASKRELEVAIPIFSHFFESPLRTSGSENSKAAAISPCHIDVSCSPSWLDTAKGIARMLYVKDGSSYVCSGNLLNSDDGIWLPYFLTANHCISTQTSASSLETYWFYRSQSCGSISPNPEYKIRSGGALLLYASASTDTAFMKLLDDPPPGAAFLGWSATPPTLNSSVSGIHHPNGDLQKISSGKIINYESCQPTSGGGFTCMAASPEKGNFLETIWSSGITEGGSSGSGLFVTSDSQRYLVGQLYGGSSTCNGSGSDEYGRFDVAYHAALKQWLKPGLPGGPTLAEALEATGLVWSTAGSLPFFPQAVNFYSGGSAAQSGPITHGKTSTVSTTLSGSGVLSWFWKVSSESKYDALRIYLDGKQIDSISGEVAWREQSLPIPIGTHTIHWEYTKDASVSSGQDAGWVDKVTWQPDPVVPVTPQSGWWWNESEPGRGYFIEIKNGRFYAGSFLYDTNGQPLWYVSGPGNTTINGLSGALSTYNGGQTLTGTWKQPSGPALAGNVNIVFSDSSHGTMTWPGGNISLVRYPIVPGSQSEPSPPFQPETGWWWNPSEGGRGFALEVQGENLFLAGFMYDSSGNPVWYISGGKMTQSNYYIGDWQQCTGGQPMIGSFKLATCTTVPSASVVIYFASTTTATMQLPDGRLLNLERFTF